MAMMTSTVLMHLGNESTFEAMRMISDLEGHGWCVASITPLRWKDHPDGGREVIQAIVVLERG